MLKHHHSQWKDLEMMPESTNDVRAKKRNWGRISAKSGIRRGGGSKGGGYGTNIYRLFEIQRLVRLIKVVAGTLRGSIALENGKPGRRGDLSESFARVKENRSRQGQASPKREEIGDSKFIRNDEGGGNRRIKEQKPGEWTAGRGLSKGGKKAGKPTERTIITKGLQGVAGEVCNLRPSRLNTEPGDVTGRKEPNRRAAEGSREH